MKTKEFRVQENRLLFKCPCCGKRRNYIVLNVRRKNIKCSECGEMTRCVFNRRPELRVIQSGLLMLTTREGREIEVMLRDISSKGVGFEVLKGKDLRALKKKQDISLNCSWNPRMFQKSRFRVQNINGLRVGAMAYR